MPDQPSDEPLFGCRLLVVEDEYFLARDLARDLTTAGATVTGPVASVAEALVAIEAEPALDGAVLDINLGGEMVYPVADVLAARHVPFVFVTGYDHAAMPSPYADHPRCEKPIDQSDLIMKIGLALAEVARSDDIL